MPRVTPTSESDRAAFRAAFPARNTGCIDSPSTWGQEMYARFLSTLPSAQQGKAGYILLWLLGVPIPILFLIFLLRGCT